jgi:hypothetical protein
MATTAYQIAKKMFSPWLSRRQAQCELESLYEGIHSRLGLDVGDSADKFVLEGPPKELASRLPSGGPEFAKSYYLARWMEVSRKFGVAALAQSDPRKPWISLATDKRVRVHVRRALAVPHPEVTLCARKLHAELVHAMHACTPVEGQGIVARIVEEETTRLGYKRLRVA